MNPQQKRQEVREKIIAACPELMELENRRYKFNLKGPGVQTDSANCVLVNVEGNKFEILGSPITLSHVLRTLQSKNKDANWYSVSTYGSFYENSRSTVIIKKANWNLTKDYDNQSDELVAYLYDVLR